MIIKFLEFSFGCTIVSGGCGGISLGLLDEIERASISDKVQIMLPKVKEVAHWVPNLSCFLPLSLNLCHLIVHKLLLLRNLFLKALDFFLFRT